MAPMQSFRGASIRRLATLAAALVLSGCTNEIDQSTRPTSVIGTYTLLRYGGTPLPSQVSSDAGGVTEVVGGELVIKPDRSWNERLDYRLSKGAFTQTVSFQNSGSWSILSEQAHMNFNDVTNSYQFTGIAAGGTVTLDLGNGTTMQYEKQQ